MQGQPGTLEDFRAKLCPENEGAFYLWLALYREAVLGRTAKGSVKRVGTIMAGSLSGRVTLADTLRAINKAAGAHFGPVANVPPGDRAALDRFAERFKGGNMEGGEG